MSVSWQELLDIFTSEMKETKHSDVWDKFHCLQTEEELVQVIYDLDMFRKRINAWHSKNARVCSTLTSGLPCSGDIKEKPPNIREVASLSHGENPDFPAASSAVELRCSREKGRHVVASKDIMPGDTLFLEDAFASVLCETQETHCEFCCLPLPVHPVRCQGCRGASYCSQLCLAQASHQYHTFECGSTLPGHVGIARLGLRVTLVAESLGCLAEEPHSPQLTNKKKTGSVRQLSKALSGHCQVVESRAQQYRRVLDLVTHLADMSAEDKLQYTLTSLLLVVDQARRRKVGASQRASFSLQFGARVLRHVTQLVCNGNAITAYLVNQSKSDAGLLLEHQARIATAIFPSASMMNHSCDPNIQTSYVGRTLVARAARHIKSGEEIFNCYGPHFRSTRTQVRRQELQQQYFFLCECPPCSRPRDFLDEEGIDALLCPRCRGPVADSKPGKQCFQCGHHLSKEQVLALREQHGLSADALHEADELAAAGDLSAAAECVSRGLQLQRLFLHANNRKLCQTLDYMAMLEARQGHYGKALMYLKCSLPILEHWHGERSVEVSGVLDNMLDIAGQYLASQPGPHWSELRDLALAWCLQAQYIVTTLLGPWHPRMPSLENTQTFLLNAKEPTKQTGKS